MTDTTTPTRGERNNNPGNIRKGIHWKGLADPPQDGTFARFTNPAAGLRALCLEIAVSIDHHRCFTLALLCNRYAPPSENDTDAYLHTVTEFSGLDPTAELDSRDPRELAAIAYGIIHAENGRCIYTPAELAQAANAALPTLPTHPHATT